MIDPGGLPYDLHLALRGKLAIQEIPHETDDWERAMQRRAAQMACKGLETELGSGAGLTDYEFVGRLERRLRRAGAEDLVILVTNGDTVPVPAKGQMLQPGFSVSVALEYRGHWAKINARSAP